MAAGSNGESGKVHPLWGVLDLILDAYAIALNCDREVARLTIMTALALGERLRLSDEIVYRMLESAVAERRRTHRC
jgi:hypothetical protein